jgi:formamidopyrimidine-DNA glycosylase
MPELPEVETVRRGLQPAMEGSKILKAEARRKDLRFPFQKDFIARLEGQTVTGLGRRAKYLMADLGSGDVLLMHLGMSAHTITWCSTCHRVPRSCSTIRAASVT